MLAEVEEAMELKSLHIKILQNLCKLDKMLGEITALHYPRELSEAKTATQIRSSPTIDFDKDHAIASFGRYAMDALGIKRNKRKERTELAKDYAAALKYVYFKFNGDNSKVVAIKEPNAKDSTVIKKSYERKVVHYVQMHSYLLQLSADMCYMIDKAKKTDMSEQIDLKFQLNKCNEFINKHIIKAHHDLCNRLSNTITTIEMAIVTARFTMRSSINITKFGVIYRVIVEKQIHTKELSEINLSDIKEVLDTLSNQLMCSITSVYVLLRNYSCENLSPEIYALLNKLCQAILILYPDYAFIDKAYEQLNSIRREVSNISALLYDNSAPSLHIGRHDRRQSVISRGVSTFNRFGRYTFGSQGHDSRKALGLKILEITKAAEIKLDELIETGLISPVESWDEVFVPLIQAKENLQELFTLTPDLGGNKSRTRLAITKAIDKLKNIATNIPSFLWLMLRYQYNYRSTDIILKLKDMDKRHDLLLKDILRLISLVRNLGQDRALTKSNLAVIGNLYIHEGETSSVSFTAGAQESENFYIRLKAFVEGVISDFSELVHPDGTKYDK